MDAKEFLNFLQSIGITTNCKASSLDAAFRNKQVRAFLVGICKTQTVENVLPEGCLADLNEADILEKEHSDEKSSLQAEFTQCEDLQSLTSVTNEAEAYVASLKEKNRLLQDTYKNTMKNITYTEQLLKDAQAQQAHFLAVHKENISELEKNLSTLEQGCQELHTLVNKCDTSPMMLYQLPMESYYGDKKQFDNHVKNFIIKQFEQRTAVLAGKDEPVTCSQQNPLELGHLVAGPHMETYKQQCKELNQIQISLGATLYKTSIQEAKIRGLQAAIKKIKMVRECGSSKKLSDSCCVGSEVALLEERIHSTAAECVARKVELIVTGNYHVKQLRTRYYLQQLDKLEALLCRQLSLDKLTCLMLQVEDKLAENTCHFLNTIEKFFANEAKKLVYNLANMDQCKSNKCSTDQQDSPASASDDLAALLKQFQPQNMLPQSLALRGTLDELILKSFDENHKYLQDIKSRYKKRDELSMATSEDQFHKSEKNEKSEPNIIRSQVDASLADFNRAMDRQKECSALNRLSKLWTIFVAHPEKLAAIIENQENNF